MKKMLGLSLLALISSVGCGGRKEISPAAQQAPQEAPKGMQDYMSKMKMPPGAPGPSTSGPPSTSPPPGTSTPPATEAPK